MNRKASALVTVCARHWRGRVRWVLPHTPSYQNGYDVAVMDVLRISLTLSPRRVLRGEPVKTAPEDAIENTVIDAIYRAVGRPLREPA